MSWADLWNVLMTSWTGLWNVLMTSWTGLWNVPRTSWTDLWNVPSHYSGHVAYKTAVKSLISKILFVEMLRYLSYKNLHVYMFYQW